MSRSIEIEREAEVRILDIDREAIEHRLVNELGARMVFTGFMRTVRVEKRKSPTYKEQGMSRRIRFVQGQVFEGVGANVVTTYQYWTEDTTKTKVRGIQQPVEEEGLAVRLQDEQTVRYGGDVVDKLVGELRKDGHIVKVDEKKHRTSYVVLGGVRYEIDQVESTLYLGRVALPPFVEIQSSSARLTIEAVRSLGYDPEDEHVVDWGMGKILKHYGEEMGIRRRKRTPATGTRTTKKGKPKRRSKRK